MSIWVFVFTLAAIIAVVAFLKRGPAGPRNYVLKAETGVFEALDKFWGLPPGSIEKSKPLAVAGHAADNALDTAIPIAKPLVPVVPGLGAVVTIAEAADKSLEAALAKPPV